MPQRLLILVLTLAVTGPLASIDGRASDGDVQYSAPYLWVDPETGELVTKSRPPQPKTHSAQPAETVPGEQAGTAAAAAPADPAEPKAAAGPADNGSFAPLAITAGILALLGAALVIVRRVNRKQTDSAVAGG